MISEVRDGVNDSEEDVVKQLFELATPQPLAVRRAFVAIVKEASLALGSNTARCQDQACLQLTQADYLASAYLSLLKAQEITLEPFLLERYLRVRFVESALDRLNGSTGSDYSAFRLALQILLKAMIRCCAYVGEIFEAKVLEAQTAFQLSEEGLAFSGLQFQLRG